MKRNKKMIKSVACTLLLALSYEMVFPTAAMALTTGPSQPEVQSFEPVGTTDMVDMFTGDFVYNIPLLDVEGYPVNISYHAGIGMEQEASWVGLGWNINPGVINRTVRGVPDDFNGQKLSKQLNIKEEHTLRIGLGVGLEVLGFGDPLLNLSADLGANVNLSNYRGVSCDFDLGAGLNLFHCVSAGVNIGVGSQTGASIDYNIGLSFSSSQIISKDMATGIGITAGSGYSSRTGLKDWNISAAATETEGGGSVTMAAFNATIPIGVKNIVPVITNKSTMNTIYARLKAGIEVFWCMGYGKIGLMYSKLNYDGNGTRESYGYMYLHNAHSDNTSILDFTRDKDGMFNKTMQYLPPGNLTYDIYSVSGQGTGGNFRPFRNDFGSVYDPAITSNADNNGGEASGGIPWLCEVGLDGVKSHTDITCGPWNSYRQDFYTPGSYDGTLYENVYLKQAGELTSVDPAYFSTIGGTNVVNASNGFPFPDRRSYADNKRDPRGNLIYYQTGAEASVSGIGNTVNLLNYTSTDGFASGPNTSIQSIPRVSSGGDTGRRSDQVSQIVQVQKDGRRYIYGIAAMNHVQREVTFSINPDGQNANDLAKGIVTYGSSDDGTANGQGVDHYYSSTETPSFAHSYLLSSVLSADYVDVTGDGPSDDDLGTYTKFNYSRKEYDYRWRAPLDSGALRAQYHPGFWSDKRDDKGSYISGSREEWLLHSIETKNFVAEFYTSKRNDAMGGTYSVAKGPDYGLSPFNGVLSDTASSYKLDSIKLYNKHDRFINGANAVPVKSVIFSYDYSLCHGVPNFRLKNGSPRPKDSTGKLTLKALYVRYGNSERSMISPYQFNYDGPNPYYSLADKDRWGNYKANGSSGMNNFEFPYTDQNHPTNSNNNIAAWSLTKIQLPSGGVIQANYECDDYAYVQNKPAAEMFMVTGVGTSSSYNDGGNILYYNKTSPCLFAYFKRDSAESSALSFHDRYLNGLSCLYFNFNVNLRGNYWEQIKGYANVQDIGICPDNSLYGYVKLAAITPEGGGANLNPVTYTAINVGRYNLPQVYFQGSDPDVSDLDNILSGLKEAFGELVSLTKNPVIHAVEGSKCRFIKTEKSFIRLSSPAMAKKGGGHRIKSLLFYDSWNQMAGGGNAQATYGKNYDYTTSDDGFGTTSSGVASYEPMIGGDENPWRSPVPYIGQSGSSWPPNDPVDLYQETPVGESLFPSPVVGYRKVTVTSIHSTEGRSSQGIDVYKFYTAKEYPAQVNAGPINVLNNEQDIGLFSQKNIYEATQGYTLTFNDMHGKPQSVEHYVYQPKGHNRELISYQQFNYNGGPGQLNNNVDVLVYDPSTFKMVKQNQQLGVEADVTVDSREKNEKTSNDNLNARLNVSAVLWFVIPIPIGFTYSGDYQNMFHSAVVTKVVQQYGILKQVVSYNEGTITTMTNEVYDPQTGQPVVTSINSEFGDLEYTVNKPAYWGYTGMGPAYCNIGYQDHSTSLTIDANDSGLLVVGNAANYVIGDELLLNYKDGSGASHQAMVYVHGVNCVNYCNGCALRVKPRYLHATSGWGSSYSSTDIKIEVVRSGRRNMLSDNMETYTMISSPFRSDGVLKDTVDNVISLKARSYSFPYYILGGSYMAEDIASNDTLPHYASGGADTLNPFAQGVTGVFRLKAELSYLQSRSYPTAARNSGLFSAPLWWHANVPVADKGTPGWPPCVYNQPYFANSGNNIPQWIFQRKLTKWSPFGKEIENQDAIGNYTAAVYGYKEELPVAVAANAQQGDIMTEGFEDYNLAEYYHNLMHFDYSPFRSLFPLTQMGSSSYAHYDLTGGSGSNVSIVKNVSHTGIYSLQTVSGSSGVVSVGIPVGNYRAHVYTPFQISAGKSYIMSFWVKAVSGSNYTTSYTLAASPDTVGVSVTYSGHTTKYPVVKKSNIIEGWQQVEVQFPFINGGTANMLFPKNYYIDDIRLYPADANMKAFVYHPSTEKLMATLDENNFATFYEYDQEGNLVRTKKETEKGIITISESRSGNPKK